MNCVGHRAVRVIRSGTNDRCTSRSPTRVSLIRGCGLCLSLFWSSSRRVDAVRVVGVRGRHDSPRCRRAVGRRRGPVRRTRGRRGPSTCRRRSCRLRLRPPRTACGSRRRIRRGGARRRPGRRLPGPRRPEPRRPVAGVPGGPPSRGRLHSLARSLHQQRLPSRFPARLRVLVAPRVRGLWRYTLNSPRTEAALSRTVGDPVAGTTAVRTVAVRTVAVLTMAVLTMAVLMTASRVGVTPVSPASRRCPACPRTGTCGTATTNGTAAGAGSPAWHRRDSERFHSS